jgi:hypothetical protein
MLRMLTVLVKSQSFLELIAVEAAQRYDLPAGQVHQSKRALTRLR